MIVHVGGGAGPIDPGFGLVELLRIGHPDVCLRGGIEAAARQGGKGSHHQVGAEASERFRQFASGGVLTYCDPLAHRHRSGIEPGLHLHHHDAGFGIAGHDCPGNWRSPAPPRQKRRV